jgi:hypothetical protein
LIFAILLTFSAVSCTGGDIPEETTPMIEDTTSAPETEPEIADINKTEENIRYA